MRGSITTANLDALGINFSLPHNALFFDLGYVASIPQQRRALDVQYGTLKEEWRYEEHRHLLTTGEHWSVVWTPSGNRHHYIYFKWQNDEARHLYARGHEQTHVLDHLGGLSLLEQRLFEHGVRVSFSDLSWMPANMWEKEHREEVRQDIIAELGAIYSLETHGYGTGFLPREGGQATGGFPHAIKIYEQGKRPARTFSLPSLNIGQLQPA